MCLQAPPRIQLAGYVLPVHMSLNTGKQKIISLLLVENSSVSELNIVLQHNTTFISIHKIVMEPNIKCLSDKIYFICNSTLIESNTDYIDQ